MTRKPQFPRSSVTGEIPNPLQAGVPAFNWADDRIWVGGPGNTVDFSIRKVDDFDQSLVYRSKDIVRYDGDLWMANKDIAAGVGFRTSDWDQLTQNEAATLSARYASGVLTGGATSLASPTSVQVASGTGIVQPVSGGDPLLISWGDFSITISGSPADSASMFLWIDEMGMAFFSKRDRNTFPNSIRLAEVLLDTSTLNATAVYDARIYSDTLLPAVEANLSIDTLPRRVLGVEITGNADQTFGITAGSVLGRGFAGDSDEVTFASVATANFMVLRRGIASGALAETNVPNGDYDAGGGALVPLSGSQTVAHRVYVNRTGQVALAYGQKAYTNLSVAILDFPSDMASSTSRPIDLLEDNWVELGAILVVNGATDLSDTAQTRFIISKSINDLYAPSASSGGDLGSAYLTDGSAPLTADMNLGGFDLASGTVDGAKTPIRPPTLAAAGDTPSSPATRELQINQIDKKVYQDGVVVADKTEVFSASGVYVIGDTVFQSDVLYRATADNGPGAFDGADWQEIGTTTDISSTLIKDPTTPTRNEVDLTGNPTAKGIVVTPDASQAANIAEFGGAIIDQYGMGRGNFGSVVVRINQAHSFGDPGPAGLALAYDEPSWVPADASDASVGGKALGVLVRTDGTTAFDLQVGGIIEDMSLSAFVGGTVTRGLVYYVSEAEPGKLTSTEPALPNRVDPVLIVTQTSPTIDGVIALTSAGDTVIEGGGQTFFQINQTAHGFTASDIGRPIYLNESSGLWAEARADDLTMAGVGLIQSITDANNFIINTAGFIDNLSASAFSGSVAPTAGRFYYVDQTSQGILTETAPTSNQNENKVLLALSPTQGVVLPYEIKKPTLDVNSSGEVAQDVNFTGNVGLGANAGADQKIRLSVNYLADNWDGIWFDDATNSIFALADTDDPSLVAPTAGTADFYAGALFEGSTNIDQIYALRSTQIIGGDGISVSNGTLANNVTVNHADTSSVGTIIGTGGFVISSLSRDEFGHITSWAQTNLDNRFLRRDTDDVIDGRLSVDRLWFNLSGVADAPALARAGDTNTGLFYISNGIWGYSRNGSRTYRFNANSAGTDTDSADGILTKNIGNNLYQTTSSLAYKDNVRPAEEREAFWSMDPIELFKEFDYGGQLEEDHPLRNEGHKVGYNLDYLRDVFPEAIKMGEFLDLAPMVSMVHREVAWMRPRVRKQFGIVKDRVEELQQEVDALKQELRDVRQEANRRLRGLADRLDALEG